MSLVPYDVPEPAQQWLEAEQFMAFELAYGSDPRLSEFETFWGSGGWATWGSKYLAWKRNGKA